MKNVTKLKKEYRGQNENSHFNYKGLVTFPLVIMAVFILFLIF